MNAVEDPVVQLVTAFKEAGVRFRQEEPLARYTTVRLGRAGRGVGVPRFDGRVAVRGSFGQRAEGFLHVCWEGAAIFW